MIIIIIIDSPSFSDMELSPLVYMVEPTVLYSSVTAAQVIQMYYLSSYNMCCCWWLIVCDPRYWLPHLYETPRSMTMCMSMCHVYVYVSYNTLCGHQTRASAHITIQPWQSSMDCRYRWAAIAAWLVYRLYTEGQEVLCRPQHTDYPLEPPARERVAAKRLGEGGLSWIWCLFRQPHHSVSPVSSSLRSGCARP